MPRYADLSRGGRAALFALATLLLAMPLLALGDPWLLKLATRIVIMGLAAAALDLALGTAGLVSFGHAAFLGLGGYVVGIMFQHDFAGTSFLGLPPSQNILLLLPLAMLVSALFAVLTGLICLRTRGVGFIMITLAFAQMLHFLFVSLRVYNGQDGIALWSRSHAMGVVDLEHQTAFYLLCLTLLILYLAFAWRMQHSAFGLVLRGIKDNERRMTALGYPTLRYRLAAYTISGAFTGLAGALLANASYFVGPSFLSWHVSGDLIVMVVLGGMGTAFGPVLGAAAWLLLEEFLPVLIELGHPGWGAHWRIVLGPLLVILALLNRRGLAGYVFRPAMAQRRALPLSAENHA